MTSTPLIILAATAHVIFNFVIVGAVIAGIFWTAVRYYERRQS